jgi:glycosyltransferase involved in cell wall biosynthesis
VTERILHATPYFAPAYVYGGPPRSVLALCHGLQRADVRVSVVTTTANGAGELAPEVTAAETFEGVRVEYLPRGFPRRSFAAPRLTAILERHRRDYDLVHVHGCWNFFGWATARWCRRAGVPYVVSPRGMLHPWSFAHGRIRKALAYRLIEARTLQGARFIHTTSDEETRIVSALGVGADIVMIPNGVDAAAPQAPAAIDEFRRRIGAHSGDFVLLFLGRLHPKKGLDVLVDAFRMALRTHRHLFLVLAGSGDDGYVARLREDTRDLQEQHRIVFPGFLDGDDRRLALASADAFVLTSHSENFGLSVAEALAAGLPVVVSRDCPWQQVEEWSAGFWVENTAAAIAGAIGRLVENPAAARAMGDNGRRAVERALDWNAVAVTMRQAYRSALAVH